MNFYYTDTRFENDINGKINNRSDMIIDFRTVRNNAASQVITDINLRSAKRRARLSPGIYEDVLEYIAPTDLDAENIIDVTADSDERHDIEWGLTTTEVLRNRPHRNHRAYDFDALLAVDEYNGERRILLSTTETIEDSVTITPLNDVTENDSAWTTTGDATNIHTDKYSYKKGSGSVAVDLNSDNGTTFGIENNGLESMEIDDKYFHDSGAIFVQVFLPSNVDDINGFDIKIGSSSSDYYAIASNKRHDGTDLSVGWNLIRFDLNSRTETGSPDKTDITYVAISVDKDSDLSEVTDFKFDHVVLRAEEKGDIYYYTKYPWVSAAGVYKRESTTGTDLLVAEEDEYKLYVLKGIALALDELEEEERAMSVKTEYQNELEKYKLRNPSNALMKTTVYEEFHNPELGSRSRIV